MNNYDLNINKINLVFFFEQLNVKNPFEIVNSCCNVLSDIVEQPPQVMPFSDDMPDDFPWFILNGNNLNVVCTKKSFRIIFNVTSTQDFRDICMSYCEKIGDCLHKLSPIIRVGLIAEGLSNRSLSDSLSSQVLINDFNNANESNISWLKVEDKFNIWTYIGINKELGINQVTFDINSKPTENISSFYETPIAVVEDCLKILVEVM